MSLRARFPFNNGNGHPLEMLEPYPTIQLGGVTGTNTPVPEYSYYYSAPHSPLQYVDEQTPDSDEDEFNDEQLAKEQRYQKLHTFACVLASLIFGGWIAMVVFLGELFPKEKNPVANESQATAIQASYQNITFLPAAMELDQVSFANSYDNPITGRFWVYVSPAAQVTSPHPMSLLG